MKQYGTVLACVRLGSYASLLALIPIGFGTLFFVLGMDELCRGRVRFLRYVRKLAGGAVWGDYACRVSIVHLHVCRAVYPCMGGMARQGAFDMGDGLCLLGR